MIVTDLWNFPTAPKTDVINISQKWEYIEQYCKKLLLDSSQTQLPDSELSISKRLEWQAYRDNIRSIQDNFSNPDDVIFPTEPEE